MASLTLTSHNDTAAISKGPTKEACDSTRVSFHRIDILKNIDEDTTAIFKNAIKEFRDSLSPKEKSMFQTFDSSRSMLADLQSRCKDVSHGRKLSGLCRRIERFAAAWEPFFEITTIFVQTHPEFAGFAWGTIRLVFLLGTNFTTYLEKIVSMIEKIGQSLPAYEEYLKLFSARRKKLVIETSEYDEESSFQLEFCNHRLYKALSYVYVDIIQFCQEACNIFGTKRGGTRYKPSLISDLFWTPFDTRFSALLDRLRTHQEIFRDEMQLEEAKYLEHQNDKRTKQSELSWAILQQIRQHIEDLRSSNDILESKILSQLEQLDQHVRTAQSNTGNRRTIERKEAEEMTSKLIAIKTWVDAPEYMREYEKATHVRLPATGEYLLSNTVYQKWKQSQLDVYNNDTEHVLSAEPNILLVKGKPGYGKTVLSSLIIEDLRAQPIGQASVFFYHFASERRGFCAAYSALRAILVQLVHTFRPDKAVIDRVAVLMDSEGSGQLRASDEEVGAALSLLLETVPNPTLVFDGIDECGDRPWFLELIRDLSAATSSKVLLLGRPNVELPMRFSHLSIYLDRSLNLPDIKLYLEPQVSQLIERKLIPVGTSVQEIANTLASRAEGMFLWSFLFMKYLGCRAISPKERLEAIFTPSLIEGLDGVYGKILGTLDRAYNKEKAKVQKIFELIAVATRPLRAEELQIAITIEPGNVTETSSLIVDFEEVIPIICGALVEVQSDKTVRFIHSSFRDFLATTSTGTFVINEWKANIRFSTLCLSYFIHDLPSSTIYQNGQGADVFSVRKTFPFIEYALQWISHAAAGFGLSNDNSSPPNLSIENEFYMLLAKFLSRPLTITVWIETSWSFRVQPSVKLLTNLRSRDRVSQHASLFDSNSLAVTLIEDLSLQLDRLNSEWGHLLKKNPSSIWGESISAFLQSDFWFRTKDTKVSSMLPANAIGSYQSGGPSRPVLVQSQVSQDTKRLGVILVLPSRSYLIAAETLFSVSTHKVRLNSHTSSSEEKLRLAKISSFGWRIRYQQRNVTNEEILVDFEVELPYRQVLRMLQQCLSSNTPHRFPFPVAFSADLNRVIVLQSVLSIRTTRVGELCKAVPQFKFQSLDRGNESTLNTPESDRVAFYSSFAPNGNALAFVFGRLKHSAIDCRRIQIWSDKPSDDQWPTFEYRGEVTSSRFAVEKEHSPKLFAFHPYEDYIVFAEWNKIAMWRFNEVGPSQKFTLLNKSVTCLEFTGSDDARLIYNMVHLSKNYSSTSSVNELLSPLNDGNDSPRPSDDEHQLFTSCPSRKFGDNLSKTTGGGPYKNPQNCLSFAHPTTVDALPKHNCETAERPSSETSYNTSRACSGAQQQPSSEATRQDSQNGTIAYNHQNSLPRMTADGAVVAGSSLLAHLPRLQDRVETHISLLPCEVNDKWVRMVWNKAAQDSYSVFDHQAPHLPSIIYRKHDTIREIDEKLLPEPKRRCI